MDKNDNEIPFSLNISPILHAKLDQHVYVLKKTLKPTITKKEWISDAIEKKLAKEMSEKERIKRICIKIDLLTKKKLENCIEAIRMLRSYSKKQWICDAIQEKLAMEEDPVKIRLKEYQEAQKS